MEYYTYAYLREDGTPYYIGKGKGNRAYIKHWRSKTRGGYFTPPEKERILILKNNLTEEEAYKHEIYMIEILGRKDLGTGILRNMSSGGKGGKGVPAWNKGGTIPEHQKEINRNMMKKRYENGLDVSGANNPRAKTWKITFQDGKVEIVKALQPWRIKNGYNKLGLRKLQLKEWKRYKDIVSVEQLSIASTAGALDAL
jgi:hypothetical protein